MRFLLAMLLLFTPSLFGQPLPLEHFAKHGDYLNMKLSPDGKHLAARVRSDGRTFLLILSSEDMSVVGGVKPGNNDVVHSATWVNNERFVYELAEKPHYLDRPIPTGELFAQNIDGSQSSMIYGYRAGDAQTGTRIATRKDTYATQEILNVLENDDKHVLIIEHPWTLEGNTWYDKRDKLPVISLLNVYTGRKKKLESLPHPGADALANDQGEIQFISWRDQLGTTHSAYRADNEAPWQDMSSVFSLDSSLNPRGISHDGKRVYLSGRSGDKRLYTLFSLDIASGEIERIFVDHETDIESWLTDTDTGLPAVGISFPGKSTYHYPSTLSPMGKIHKMLVSAFGGQTVQINSSSEGNKQFLVHVSSDVNPGEFYLFERKNMKARFLWANRSWIDPANMAKKHPVNLLARDDTPLSGYLTLPAAQPDKEDTLPSLVVMVHGGPHQSGTRDFWDYDSEVQMLANRGHAVLQINFRGSDGYGQNFIESGYRQWGGKMIEDIIDATRWTIDNKYVDGDRICIYGASYGGYAALMAAAKSPALYQCAIGYVGVYDLHTMFTESDIPGNWGGKAYLRKVLGTDKQQLDAYSPVNYADQIEASVMLIHGSQDKRVPEVNAELMKEKLEAADNAPVYLRYRQSGHGVWNEESRIEMYQGMLDFLDSSVGKG